MSAAVFRPLLEECSDNNEHVDDDEDDDEEFH